MADSANRGEDSSGLRFRRPSHHDDDDDMTDDSPVPSATSALNSNFPSESTHSTANRTRCQAFPISASLHDNTTGTGSWAGGEEEMSGRTIHSDSDAPPYTGSVAAAGLSLDTAARGLSSGLTSPESSTLPDMATSSSLRVSPTQTRHTISPISSGTRNREYSLRRVLFARNADHAPQDGDIELAEAGPLTRPQNIRPSSILEEGPGKKLNTSVTVSPGDGTDLPQAPDAKKPFGTLGLPDCNLWTKQGKQGHRIRSKIAAAYNLARKKILRIREIQPSKDGRHLDLDAYQKGRSIDERTHKEHISNYIRSSRYTLWNFLPRQIIFQFGKLANFYFLVISIMQLIPGLSTTGSYTTLVPLLAFVSISIAKEGYDDLRRYKLDKVENNKLASVLQAYQLGQGIHDDETQAAASTTGAKQWNFKKWQDVRVGDIVRLQRNDAVPADLVLLHADGPNGVAYIETMALDGETNLKAKQASPVLAKRCRTLDSLVKCNAHFVVEDPNTDLYNFDGRVTADGKTLPLTTNEIVYRGSILRNTAEAIGMVINTGEECKIRMNANKNPRAKAPSLQAVVNQVVIVVVILVLFLAILNTIAYQVWASTFEKYAWYLRNARVPFTPILTAFIIMFNTMIPLSLYVSLEIIKLGQLFLMQDVDMYDPVTDTPMETRTTTINEELGQVSYIFSDKTGTLTDNVMRFRKMSVAGTAWLHDFDLQEEAAGMALKNEEQSPKQEAEGRASQKIRRFSSTYFSANYSISDDIEHRGSLSRRTSGASLWRSTARPAKDQPELRTEDLLEYLQYKPHGVFARKAKFFLLSLALCHTCLPERQKDGQIDFQAASPDELALVRAAQELGYIVVDRDSQTITLKTRPGGPQTPEITEIYEVLDVIEFSSKRKRMSIIVRFPDGRRCIFCKGADSVVMKRLKLASLAIQKVAQVERRASVRKSLEAEQALRKMSEASPRSSLSRDSVNLNRRSMSRLARSGSTTHNLEPVRDVLDSWLRDREQDVDLTSVDSPGAYAIPRTSLHNERRRSIASSDPQSSNQWGNWYFNDLVDETMAVNDAVVFERTFQHIDDFATEGLRTLLYGYRFLDEHEYHDWKKVFHDAMTSLVNRQELVEKAGEIIEQDFELAGATAIEDKLQRGVPETIDKLRRANIKMWMLTGDKRETAINIGHSCRLIKDYSNVIILDHETGQLENLMAASILRIGRGGIPHSVVVVDGQTLTDIESDETLAFLFFDLALIADSVICCRASPSQKAFLVKQIRKKVAKSVTLAIGDGANDIAMIQEAHVGIGITGKEGLQAARISDYSIAQFRFLQKLLLVHGRWNYIRIGKYVLGTFWKELLFYLTQALYQRWNGYTGTSLYEPWSLSMFNTLFTSLPVILLGIFEQDLSATTLLAVPELYSQGQRNAAFNFKKYFLWMVMATAEAMIIYFLMLYLYGLDVAERFNGIFAMGDLSFSCCVIIINTKLLFIEMHYKTLISVTGWLLSVIGWTLWNVALSAVYSYSNSTVYAVKFGFLKHFGGSGKWWFILILIVNSVIIFEFAVLTIKKRWLASDVDIWQVLEKDKVIKKRLDAAVAGEIGLERDEEREIQDLLDSSQNMTRLTTIPTADSVEAREDELRNRRHSSEDICPRETVPRQRQEVDEG